MLAFDLLTALEGAGLPATGCDLPEIDITSPESVRSRIEEVKPGLVINCAAYTAVDKAETETGAAYAVNRDGPANLARACAVNGIPLIHFSTDYVFDGRDSRPYLEDDPPNPLGEYGRSKLAGERAVAANMSECIIVRTAWLYGVHGNNFVKTILRLAGEREELRVVSDQRGCPTWARDLADAVARFAALIVSDRAEVPWGIYHFCGGGAATRFEFAAAIVEEARKYRRLKVERIVPIATSEYPTAAVRPADTVLDCGKVFRCLGIAPPPWRKSLGQMIASLLGG